LEEEGSEKKLNGLKMELMDGAYYNINEISYTIDIREGFKDMDAVILLGSIPREDGMTRSDILAGNCKIF